MHTNESTKKAGDEYFEAMKSFFLLLLFLDMPDATRVDGSRDVQFCSTLKTSAEETGPLSAGHWKS